MLKSATLSDNAKNVVNNFFSENFREFLTKDIHRCFIVSLYATMPQADNHILNILTEYKFNLLEYISPENLTIIQQEYAEVVHFCYDSVNLHGSFFIRKGEDTNISWMPKDLVDLCLSIAEVEEGSDIYLPFSGEAQFAYYLPKCSVDGFERDEIAWAFSQILLSSKNSVSHIELSKHGVKPSLTGKKYDYIFTLPPYSKGEDEQIVIDTLYDLARKSLNEDGAMFCILPMAFCNASHGWFDLRKILFDSFPKYSAAVISLPPMLHPYTGVNICLVVLMKDNKDRVILMDANRTEFFAFHDVAGYTETELKVNSIVETIQKGDERYLWVGYPTDLTDSLNLTPSRYLIPQTLPIPKRGKEVLLPMSELVEVVTRTRLELKPVVQQFVDVNMLSSNYLNCEIHSNSITPSDMTKVGVGKRKIGENNCLLASFFGDKAKVGKLVGFSESQVVTIHGYITPFKLKTNVVREDFLLRALMAESTLRQVKMQNGSRNENTRISDFLNLRIIVPSLEEQERLCKEDTRVSLSEADRKLLESAEEFRRDMHVKKHAVGQTLSNLNNWWNILLLARTAGNGTLHDTDVIGVSNKVEVSKIFENLSNIISQLQTQISRFDRGNGLKVSEFALTDFIERYIETHQSPLFSFEYDSSLHRAAQDLPVIDVDEHAGTVEVHKDELVLREGDPLEYVNFAKEALTIIFDNIISNACSHGFTDMPPELCKVKIEIFSEGTDYVVAVSNNGSPISEKLSKEDIFVYGRSTQLGKSHFGIGSYEVKQLMREFGGDVEIVSSPQQKFTVSYHLIFHNTNIQLSF